MDYGEDDSIKGDFQIDARGSSALVERDLQNQSILQMGALVANPGFGIDPEKWFQEMCKAQRLDPKRFLMDEEKKAAMAQQPPPMPPQIQAAQIRAQAVMQKAQLMLQADAQKTQAEIANTNAQAAERLRVTDPVQEFAKTGKFTPASLAAFARSRNVGDLELAEKLSQTEIEKLQTYRDTLTDPQKIAEVNAVIKANSEGKAPKVTINSNIKMGGDAVGLMKGIADLTEPEQNMLKSAQTSKTLINEAAASNNSQTWEAARTQIAKAVGEGKLSNEDIRRTGVDPRLVQGALDWVNKKTVGVPNQDIMKQLYVVADLLEKQATNRINNTMTQARTLATDQSGVSPAAAETIFPMVGGGSRGSGGTVNWSDMK
jgi:hypothetical protein